MTIFVLMFPGSPLFFTLPFISREAILVIICCLFVFTSTVRGQAQFRELDEAIRRSADYDKGKEEQIQALKREVLSLSYKEKFNGLTRLYEAYRVFNYDSAYHYANEQLLLAYQLGKEDMINCSRNRLAFVMLSAGLFKEALDTLEAIKPANQPPGCKPQYFTLLARCYYDLADYAMDSSHSPHYNGLGNRYLDSALKYQGEGFDRDYYRGLRHLRAGEVDIASGYLEDLVRRNGLTLHQQALATSTLSDIYIRKGNTDSAILLLQRAAIADIRSSTKETSAIFHLSKLLFEKGDVKNAYPFIQKAVADALAYGARQRKVQMSSILPLIEGEKMAGVEREKRTVIYYAVIVTILLLVLVYLLYIIATQVKKLKLAQNNLKKAHADLQALNDRLLEANKIKEEYIGFFFDANTAFYDKMERFRKKMSKKIQDKKLEDIDYLVSHLPIQEEREDLLKNFDMIFLKIFPGFVEGFNALFTEENQTVIRENEVLNTELRIFALIRLGITDNHKIASILGYSVNTINTYKTRIKNRSLVSNEQFEQHVLEIPSV